MNKWKEPPFSVVSNPPESNFFFVPLPFTTHIPEPGPIWNTKVWPLLHLKHSHHSHLLRQIHSSRSFAGRCKSVNEHRFLPRLHECASNRLMTSFAFGGVEGFSYASIPNSPLQTAGWSSSCFCICLHRSELQMWLEMFRLWKLKVKLLPHWLGRTLCCLL